MKTFLRLLGFLKPYPGQVALSVLLGLGTVASGVGLMGTSAYLIAMAGFHPSIAVLQVAIVGVRFFGLARGAMRYLERLVSHSVNFKLLAELRVWFYRAVEPEPAAAMLSQKSGDLLNTAVSDIETLENFYVRAAAPFVTSLLATLGVGLFLGGMHPRLGWIAAGGMLLAGMALPVGVYLLARGPARKWTRRRAWTRAFLVESLQGLADLTTAGRNADRRRSLEDLNRAQAADERRLALAGAFSNGLGQLIMGLTMAAALFAGARLVNSGELEGVLLAVVCLVTLASFEAALPVQEAAHQLEKNLEAGKRLFDLGSRPVPGKRFEPLPQFSEAPAIRLAGLTFGYDPGSPILKDIDITLTPGKILAVVGASGAGKTTLARLLTGLWDAPPGAYFVGGADAAGIEREELRRLFSVVSQNPYLFSATIRENLRLANPLAVDDEMTAALRQAGLGQWFERLPQGLDTWTGENGLRLSGGERQRLSAARALLRRTPFLILDEPLAQVDATGERPLLENLLNREFSQGVLWITHRLSGLERAQEIIFLEEGRIAERGRLAELTAKGGRFARLYALEQEFLPGQGQAGTEDA